MENEVNLKSYLLKPSGKCDSNNKYYGAFLMTPKEHTSIFSLDNVGKRLYRINYSNNDYSIGILPVINLKNNILINSGDGIRSNPYTVKLN